MATLPGLSARARAASALEAEAAAMAVSRSDSSWASGPGSSTLAKAATCWLRVRVARTWVRTPNRLCVCGETSSSGPAAAGRATAAKASATASRIRVRPSPNGVSPRQGPVAHGPQHRIEMDRIATLPNASQTSWASARRRLSDAPR